MLARCKSAVAELRLLVWMRGAAEKERCAPEMDQPMLPSGRLWERQYGRESYVGDAYATGKAGAGAMLAHAIARSNGPSPSPK